MGSDIFIGFDLGTTMLKGAAFRSGTGRVLASGSVRLKVALSADGGREQRPREVLSALARIAQDLRSQLGRDWRNVAGLGLAAQGGSAILARRETGEALTPMQLWSDTRPLRLLPEIARRKPASYWRRLSYLDGPGAGLGRIVWLQRRHPRLFRSSTIYVGAGEYVYFRLTGAWRQDAGSALQIGCYDARRDCIAAEPLALVGLSPSAVAPMRRGHEIHPLSADGAKLLRLSAGLPVAGPYMDHEAGFLSACAASSRPLQCSLGTAWVGNFIADRDKLPEWGLNLVLPSPTGKGRLVLRVMLSGNAAYDWGLKTFLGNPSANIHARADEVFRRKLLPPPGLLALPWLTRPNLLLPQYPGAGGFFGVTPLTSRSDMLRALVAGMCYEFARLFDPLVRGGRFDLVALSGGASNSRHVRAMLAGLFDGLPTAHIRDDFSGCRGTLFAFDNRVSQARRRPVGRPPRAVRDELARGLDHHHRLCRALSRGMGDGGGLHLTGDAKETPS